MPALHLILGVLVLSCSTLVTAEEPVDVSEPKREREQDWLGLVEKLHAVVALPEDDAPASKQAAKENLQRREKSIAAAAKEFYTRHPGHERAAEARRIEIISLLNCADAGDVTAESEARASAQAFRADVTAPAFERAVVAGSYEFREAGKRSRDAASMLKEFERVARGLIAEFPDQPQGYESLLSVARDTDDLEMQRMIAAEVVSATSAPRDCVTKAEAMLRRLDLLGQSVEKIFVSADSALKPAEWRKKRAGIIYFWATWSPPSLEMGEMLAGRKLAKANLVGICLDKKEGSAQPTAAVKKLPGQLLYPLGGLESRLATELGADSAPLVYFVDAEGRIADVHGIDDLEAKLNSAGW